MSFDHFPLFQKNIQSSDKMSPKFKSELYCNCTQELKKKLIIPFYFPAVNASLISIRL